MSEEKVEVIGIAEAPQPAKTNAPMRPGFGVLFQSVAEVWAVADGLRKGGAGPKGSTTGSIAAAIIKGQALGLDPVTSMSFITIVNGRASLMGDLALGLVRKSGLIDPKKGGYLREEWSGEGDSYHCKMSAKRSDTGEEMARSFSVGEARRAGLIGKTAIWAGFLDRMLRYRALGFLLRDLFSDILLGLYLTEELQAGDYFEPKALPPTEKSALPEGERPPDPFFQAPEEAPALPAGEPEPEVLPDDAVTVLPEPEPAKTHEAAPDTGIEATFNKLAKNFMDAAAKDAATADPFEGFRDGVDPVTIKAPEVKAEKARKVRQRRMWS